MIYIFTLSCKHEIRVEVEKVRELHAVNCLVCKQPKCAYWYRGTYELA